MGNDKKRCGGCAWQLLKAAVACLLLLVVALIALPFVVKQVQIPEFTVDVSQYLKGKAAQLVANKSISASASISRGTKGGLRINADGRILDWPFSATASANLGFLRTEGEFAVKLLGTDFRLVGDFEFRSTKKWRFAAHVPETDFSSDDAVLGRIIPRLELSSISNITCTGRFSFEAEGRCTDKIPLPAWNVKGSLKDVDASLATGKHLVTADNLRIKFGASGLAGKTDLMPMFPRADSIQVAGVVLSNVFASVRATERSYLVTEAGAECCGGELRLYSLFLDPEKLSAGATIYVDGVDAGEVLTHISAFKGTATGRLHGKLPFFLKDGKELHLRDAYLFSTPGVPGNVRITNAQTILDNLGAAGVPESQRTNLSKALSNLDYNVLKVELKRGEDGDDSALALVIEGTSTHGATTVPVKLNVTFRGDLDQLVNTGINISRKKL